MVFETLCTCTTNVIEYFRDDVRLEIVVKQGLVSANADRGGGRMAAHWSEGRLCLHFGGCKLFQIRDPWQD